MPTKHWNNGDGGGFLLDDGNWLEGTTPGASDLASIDASAADPPIDSSNFSVSKPHSFNAVTFVDGNAADYAWSGITCVGLLNLANVNSMVIENVGSVSGQTIGSLTINNLTGTVSASNANGTLTINGGTSTAVLNYDNGDLSVNVSGTNAFHGTINVANGEICDLGGAALPADVTIAGTGTLTGYTIAAANTYATQLSGSKAIGSTQTIHSTLGAGFAGDDIFDQNGNSLKAYTDANVSASAGTVTFKVVQDAIDGGFDYSVLTLHDTTHSNDIGIGGFTIGAASAGGGGGTAAMLLAAGVI